MRIGIDLHGVINTSPQLFNVVLTNFLSLGVEVYIVSGPPKPEITDEMEKLGFEKGLHYKEIHSIVDFLKESGVEMWQDKNGEWWANDKDWCTSKAKICDKLHLDVMIDDQEMYKPSFKNINTKFLLYKG